MTENKPILIEVSRLIFRLFKGKTITGIDRVTQAYIQQYKGYARAVISVKGNISILNQQSSALVFQMLLDQQLNLRNPFFWKILSKQIVLTEFERKQYAGCIYLNLNHKGIESQFYIRKLQQLKLKPVFFIHDLIPVYFPEFCRPQEQSKHTQRVKNMLQYGHALIVNSAYTKQEVERFALEQDLNCPQITVSWLSSNLHHNQRVALKPHLQLKGKNYFVVLATIEARKNHLMLLQIWQRLIKQMGENAPYLVLIGQRGWEAEQVFDLLDRCEIIKSRVIEFSTTCDTELKALLQGAKALLFPSFVEGYGLPLVEALSLGIPVLASEIVVFEEIGQGIPEFIDFLDTMRWHNLILEYLQLDSPLRHAQMLRMQNYRHWEWADHFKEIQDLIQDRPQAVA